MTDKLIDRYRRNSLRLPNFDYSSRRIYFVTLVTQDRRKVFWDSRLAESVCQCLASLSQTLGFQLFCYCLMPDHLHALIGVGECKRTLGQICGAFKSVSTRQYWQWHQGRLWQRQFFDHIIRQEFEHFETVEYIRMNPVRKGLVLSWEDWPYTGGLDS
jgi:putative transposase